MAIGSASARAIGLLVAAGLLVAPPAALGRRRHRRPAAPTSAQANAPIPPVAAPAMPDAAAGVACAGPVELGVPTGWFPAHDRRDPDDDIYLISPFIEGSSEIRIKVVTYPRMGSLDALLRGTAGAVARSGRRERVMNHRRFRLAGSNLEVEETLSLDGNRRSYVTWYAVVRQTGVVVAGIAPTKAFVRYLPQFEAALFTLTPRAGSGHACRSPLVRLELAASERAAATDGEVAAWRNEAFWLYPKTLDLKLDFDAEVRHQIFQKSDRCTSATRPNYEPGASEPRSLLLTASCASGARLKRVIDNKP